MERNYDEIIADMLIQLDVHTQELTSQSRTLEKQSLSLEKQSMALEKQSRESSVMHGKLVTRMEIMEKMDGQLMEQLVHSAIILDRIIKKNDLKL